MLRTSLIALLVLAAACDGKGIVEPPEPEPEPQIPNFVQLQSDQGDYIGQGRSYSYSQADARLTVEAFGNRLEVGIAGDQDWRGEFQLPSSAARVAAGTYANVARYPFHNPAAGGLSWGGEGRGCNMLRGSFTISSVQYAGDTLKAVDLTFEQRCENAQAVLRGSIHWRADDRTQPPGPANPAPAGLWQPAAGSTPTTARYIYLVSEPGDYIGQGGTFRYTNNEVSVTAVGRHLRVGAGGWTGEFEGMSSVSRLEPGYYGSLQRFPFHNPVRGGLSWGGQGRGCNTLTGWFVVDRITYAGSTLTALDLRFEQHCEGGGPALRGAVHWTA